MFLVRHLVGIENREGTDIRGGRKLKFILFGVEFKICMGHVNRNVESALRYSGGGTLNGLKFIHLEQNLQK